MVYSNGRVPASVMAAAEPGNLLQKPQVRAFRRLRTAAKAAGHTLTIIDPDGAYRSLAVQKDMHVHPGRHNISTASTVAIAAPGYSSHGLGTRADFGISGGAAGFAWLLHTAPKYGWTREFGAADPNHFMHDGRTATSVIHPAKKTITVQVQPGDTLNDIADDTDTTVNAILHLNPTVKNPNLIRVGQILRVR